MENSTCIEVQYVEINGFRYPRPIRRAPASLRRKESGSGLNSSDDQTNQEKNSVQYRDGRYDRLLETNGSYMHKLGLGITTKSKALHLYLLALEQSVPQDSLFRDDLFEKTYSKAENTYKARVVRSITPYITPSAEDLETLDATHLEHLVKGVNEC